MAGTHFYIDALNLYYGAVKNTPYKWLDFEALARTLVPRDHIGLIRYFTAIVRPRYPGDRAHERQNAYLRAIDTNPLIDITRGHFRTDVKWRPLAEAKCAAEDLFRPRLRPTWLVRLLLSDARRRQTQPATFAHVIDPEEGLGRQPRHLPAVRRSQGWVQQGNRHHERLRLGRADPAGREGGRACGDCQPASQPTDNEKAD